MADTADMTKPATVAKSRSVSAVTVSYFTGPTLWQSLAAQLGQPELRELVLVDNGNDAATRERLEALAATDGRIRLLRPPRNIGFAAGCNLGAAAATSDYIAFVNPDCVPSPGAFGAILAVFDERPDAWLCGGRLQNPDGSEQRGGRREILTPWRAFVELIRLDRLFPDHPYFRRLHAHERDPMPGIAEVPTVSGAFMMIPRQHYERLGGMDDNMFLHFDDADLCIRVQEQGGKVLYVGHVPITHFLSTSDVSRIFVEWHKTRSTSYYFVKHFQKLYPRWFLSFVSSVLWVRFGFLCLRALPSDLSGMIRRLGRR